MIGLCINNREPELSVLDIVEGTSVDGVGLRTSIYFAGCENACEGCHNPQSWNMANGKKYSVDTLYDIVREVDMNVTFSGGDPMLRPGRCACWQDVSRKSVERRYGVIPGICSRISYPS